MEWSMQSGFGWRLARSSLDVQWHVDGGVVDWHRSEHLRGSGVNRRPYNPKGVTLVYSAISRMVCALGACVLYFLCPALVRAICCQPVRMMQYWISPPLRSSNAWYVPWSNTNPYDFLYCCKMRGFAMACPKKSYCHIYGNSPLN